MREVFSVPKTTGIPAEYPKKECPEMPVPSGEDLLSVFFSDERTRIVALVASILGAGLFLYTSRITVVALLPAIILLGVAVLLACNSRHKLFRPHCNRVVHLTDPLPEVRLSAMGRSLV